MSEQTPPNGDAAAGDQAQGPTLRVLAQYTKDLSFENPNVPDSLRTDQEAPNVEVSLDVQARSLQEDNYESSITLRISSKRGETVAFLAELTYGGVFLIKGVPKENLQPILLIECPRLLFPFARAIISEAIRDGGFPPLMLEPIDFQALYRQRMAQQEAQAQSEAS